MRGVRVRWCFQTDRKSSNPLPRMAHRQSQDGIRITPPLRGSRRQAKADAVGGPNNTRHLARAS